VSELFVEGTLHTIHGGIRGFGTVASTEEARERLPTGTVASSSETSLEFAIVLEIVAGVLND
jgi:hypothetical protein